MRTHNCPETARVLAYDGVGPVTGVVKEEGIAREAAGSRDPAHVLPGVEAGDGEVEGLQFVERSELLD